MSPEEWLAANAIECKRWELRVSPETCRTYQEQWPLRCDGCERYVAPAEGAEPKRKKLVNISLGKRGRKPAERKDEPMAKVKKPCAECGREMNIQGRGLCGRCYYRAERAKAKGVSGGRGGEVREEKGAAESGGVVPGVGAGVPAAAAAGEPSGAGDLGDHPRAGDGGAGGAVREFPKVELVFLERDAELLETLRKSAERNRRTLADEVLFRLDFWGSMQVEYSPALPRPSFVKTIGSDL